MNSPELQQIIDDLDSAQSFVPEDDTMRDSLEHASSILAWLSDEVVESIPHFNVIRRD